MKRAIALVVILCAQFSWAGDVQSNPRLQRLLKAICLVESGESPNPKDGDGGKAIGPMQIHKVYWLDSRVPGDYQQCRDKAYAERVMIAYWTRYCPVALENVDCEVLARTHNGGWAGPRRTSTLKYWARVEKAMK